MYRSTFAKCHALWNKYGRLAMAVEAVTDASVLRLKRPNAARWNSVYLAMEQGPWRKRVQEALRQAIRCQINQYRSGILGRVRTRHETHRTGTEHPPVRDWIWDIFCQPYASSKKNFTTWKPHLPSASH